MNTLEQSIRLQLQLTQLSLQLFISQQTVAKFQAEVNGSLRPARTPLAVNEKDVFTELSATCKRLDEFLTEILAAA